jgi:hypothetical protein
MKVLTPHGWDGIKVKNIFFRKQGEMIYLFEQQNPLIKELIDNTGKPVKNPVIMSLLIQAACILSWRK